MRNLRNVRYDRWTQPGVTATCWDPETDNVLALTGPDEEGSVALLRFTNTDTQTVATWTAPSPNPSLPNDIPLSLHHLSGTSQTVIVFAGGDIVLVNEQPELAIEIIGTIDSGIAAARWSPDEELLMVVTNEKNVIFMNSSFDPVTERRMGEEDLKASKHVSVGWGKRETQFQGRGARAMRDPTIPERVDEGILSTNDKSEVNISWRGDGQFVAISGVEAGRRVIRVFSREGELDSASEPVDGLEATISWRPSGNLIASVQRKTDNVDIVFFERNGLRHGEFTLRSPSTDITQETNIQLEWNSDSTVLAVRLSKLVQFWTMGNYHWYLKQEIPLKNTTALSWHPEKSLKLSVADVEGLVSTEHILHIARGECAPPNDTGAVGVVDGNEVKLTAFRTANVPPPMAQLEVKTEGAVVDVAFAKDNATFAILHQRGVDAYDWPVKNGRSIKPVLKSASKFEDEQKTLLGVSANSDGAFTWMEASPKELPIPGEPSVEYRQITLSSDGTQQSKTLPTQLFLSNTTSFAQDRLGKVQNLLPSNDIPPTFPLNIPSFELTTIASQTVAFGLTRTGHLYANTRLLVKNATSFLLTPDHLIFTTNNHLVKYVHLVGGSVDELDVPNDDPETDERVRSIERGAKLVTAMPTTMCIILQMPRGNLETIFPRAMVLKGVRRCVDEKDYGKAFRYCRTQRVDMNILYDHKPAQFVENTGLFLDQLDDVSYIDLFLSSLREEDVTQTMYRDTRTSLQPNATTTASATSKVNTICNALLSALQPREATNLQNTITSHVCKSPPALEDALLLVSSLHATSSAQAERAIEHICFLIDVNRLYDTALGLYNLDLALLVAQQSQRDPREYLPFIQNLHTLEENRRKFEIDEHLTRREKALTHLHALGAFEELCDYTQKHTLYSSSLRLYRHSPENLATLTNLYAEYLESTSSHREAGLAYESLGNFAKATTCYRTAGSSSWQECLYCAGQQDPPLEGKAMEDLASALADALSEDKNHQDAAEVYLRYLNSPEQALKSLCKASQFASALRLTNNNPSLLDVFDTALTEALSSTTEFLSDCKSQLAAQIPRIHLLREKALSDPLAFYEGEIPASMANIPDDVSVASTHVSTSASLFTRYTGKGGGASTGTLASGVSRATSRNRKREEKKRARGRKGTVYEEEYLVNSTRRLIERVESTKPEVERLIFALCRRSMAERSRAIEALMVDVHEACIQAVEDVFGGGEKKAATEGEEGEAVDGIGGEVWKPVGGDAVLQDWEMARRRKVEAPVVGKMKKLNLLGA